MVCTPEVFHGPSPLFSGSPAPSRCPPQSMWCQAPGHDVLQKGIEGPWEPACTGLPRSLGTAGTPGARTAPSLSEGSVERPLAKIFVASPLPLSFGKSGAWKFVFWKTPWQPGCSEAHCWCSRINFTLV